jgi:site-specific recombinase XerD
MSITNSIITYRRQLKRRNYSPHTVKNYLTTLTQFVMWVDVPIEAATNKTILRYIDYLADRGLKPKTINCHLDSIRGFYEYLRAEEEVSIPNPIRRGYALKVSRPLPKHLRDEDVIRFLRVITSPRDRALFTLMLRCGLRVEEVAKLTVDAIQLTARKLFIHHGKGGKARVVYLSNDAARALHYYLTVRPPSRARSVFLAEKKPWRGKPLSVRGIQKRMEYYARKARLKLSCHHLRHTMATQLLNADADLVTIQDLLGHTRIKTTQRYCTVSNLKVQRDYHRAMDKVLQRSSWGGIA